MIVIYPPGLPAPTSIQILPSERSRAAGLERGNAPASVEVFQRDYGAVANLTWAMNAGRSAQWLTWWRLCLDFGGAWFRANRWPMPWGTGAIVRFLTEPRVSNLGRGIRGFAVDAEIRGAGLDPMDDVTSYPMRLVPIMNYDIDEDGASMLPVLGAVFELDHEMYRVNAARTSLELLGDAVPLGTLINPQRASLPSGAIQFRGATDAASALGRLGIVINGDNNTAAAARLQAGAADRYGASGSAGRTHFLPWDDTIELVHIGQLSMAGTYAVVDTGPCSAASAEFARLTFTEADNIRALLVEEMAVTNYAGAAGTGSARLVRLRGVQQESES